MRPIVRAAAAALLASAAMTAAAAAPSFDQVVAFGDSYADIGNAKAQLGPLFPAAQYPTGRFSGGTNFVDTIASIYGVPQENFAVGGARADSGNVALNGVLPGFQQQWQAFTDGGTIYVSGVRTSIPAGGLSFAPSDLAVFSVGGNDARGYRISGGTLAGADAAAAASAAAATAGLDALVPRGIEHLVWTAGDVGQLPEAAGSPSAAIGSAFSTSYNTRMQAVLSGVAASGVQVAYVDITAIGDTVRANPARFGFTNVTDACPAACSGDPSLQRQYFFYTDGLHLSSAGFALVGGYAVNQIEAPYSLRANGDAPRLAAEHFARTVGTRLDIVRAGGKAGLSVYGAFAADRERYHGDAASNGYRYTSRGGYAGVEYGFGPATVGAIGSYERGRVNGRGDDRARADSYQLAGYASVVAGPLFAQAYAGFGRHDLAIRRTGVGDPLEANPHAHSAVAGAKAGYLLPFGPVLSVGPSAALDYARARLKGYTEAGDAAASLIVGSQTSKTLIGSLGIEARAGLPIGPAPWLRVAAAKDLQGDGRTIRYAPEVAPTIVDGFDIPDASQAVYGTAAAGVSVSLVKGLTLDLSGGVSFGRHRGNDADGSIGLRASL